MIRSRLCLVPVLLLLLAAPAAAADVDLPDAQGRLKVLERELGSSRAASRDILDALAATAEAYHGLVGPPEPELKAAFDRDAAKFKRGAERQFLRALKLVKVKGEMNIREDVNVEAAKIIGATGNQRLWLDVQSALERSFFHQKKYEVSSHVLDACFDAIAALSDPNALGWILKDFVHTKASPERDVVQLLAAQQSIPKFPPEAIDGRLRFEIVQKMVRLYSSVESVAHQSSNEPGIQTTKRFWDRISRVVIGAVQFLSGTPRNEEGEALATMEEFAVWFRDHKNPNKAPWSDR